MPKKLVLEFSQTEIDALGGALEGHSIVAMTDAKGRFTYVNDTFTKLTGYSRKELLGKTHKLLGSNFHSKDFYANLWGTIEKGRIWKGDVRDKAKDGRIIWLRTLIFPRVVARKPNGYITVRTPITDLMASVEKQIAQGIETEAIKRLRDGSKLEG